jgi:hypothetical protein
MREEQETGFMHDLGLGKGQRHAHKTGQSLAQRSIPTLDMGGFSRLFAHGRMLLLRDDRSIDSQKVGEAMALAILLRNRLPQLNKKVRFYCLFPSVNITVIFIGIYIGKVYI